jgi:GWxTD domain-containing protein
MKNKLFALFLFFSLIFPVFAEQIQVKDLPSKYKTWLEEEVVYIIAAREKEVFLQLGSDKERDIFIEAFWKQRDPTPGTPENEFFTEHYRRIAHANKFFGRETYRPGWKTDRGKIYIILGEPRSMDKFEGLHGLHPVHIWYYQGAPEYGLPSQFNIVFFKREGLGEFVLYSPAQDGPYSLLSYLQVQVDAVNIEAAYEKIFESEPTIAINSLTLIPGEQVLPGQVSLASDIMISSVWELPEKKVRSDYANALLKYKDIVEVDYTANYIGNDSLLKIIQDDRGTFFVHYSIEPERLSIATYEGKYYTNFQIHGNIQDLEGKSIFQYEKNFPLEFDQTQVQRMSSQDFAIQDMFPLVPGDYRFNLLLKNSVAKEFTSFESHIHIPAEFPSLQISSLLLGYEFGKNPSPATIKPFQIENMQIKAQPHKAFIPTDKLTVFFQITGADLKLKDTGLIKYSINDTEKELITLSRNMNEYPHHSNIIEEFDLGQFPPGFYKIKVAVLDEAQNEISHVSEDFQISSVSSIPRPLVVAKSTPVSKRSVFSHILGIQLFNKGQFLEAKEYLEKAYHQNPTEVGFAIDYSRVLFRLHDFDRVKTTLFPFAQSESKDPSVLELLARAHQALGELNEAIAYYKQHLDHFGTNIFILNTIGDCYFSLGNLDEALYAWEKSLEINPEQENIQKKVNTIKRNTP